jgi:TM2 domain-containing membrane protein YozV
VKNSAKLKIVVVLSLAGALISSTAHCQSEKLTGEEEFVQTKRGHPTGALLMSAFVPGLGQFYNGKYIKGTLIAGGEGYLIYGIYNDWRDADRFERNFKNAVNPITKAAEFANYEKARDRRNLKMWILTAAIFYSMFDAYVDAHLSDFDQKDRSYEVFLAPTDDGFQVALRIDID